MNTRLLGLLRAIAFWIIGVLLVIFCIVMMIMDGEVSFEGLLCLGMSLLIGCGGGSSTAAHPYTLDDKQIEVIGNIFDTPELLEKKDV